MKRRMLRVEMERRREEERRATKAMLEEANTAASVTALRGRLGAAGTRRRASIMHVDGSSFEVRSRFGAFVVGRGGCRSWSVLLLLFADKPGSFRLDKGKQRKLVGFRVSEEEISCVS